MVIEICIIFVISSKSSKNNPLKFFGL